MPSHVLRFTRCPVGLHKGELWEKLQGLRVRELFTTFRGYETRKHRYYLDSIGQDFQVEVNRCLVGRAVLVSVVAMMVHDITEAEIKADTFKDWTVKEFEEMAEVFYKLSDPAMLKLTFMWEDVTGGNKDAKEE